MDSIEIKEKISRLNMQLKEYATTLFELESTQQKIDELTIEFLAAVEDEKNNPWLETPDVLFIKSDKAPRLMIYPFVNDYYGKPFLKGYNTVAKKLVGISSSTSRPYKFVCDHPHSKETGHWCASFRVHERQLEVYRDACLEYLRYQINPGIK